MGFMVNGATWKTPGSSNDSRGKNIMFSPVAPSVCERGTAGGSWCGRLLGGARGSGSATGGSNPHRSESSGDYRGRRAADERPSTRTTAGVFQDQNACWRNLSRHIRIKQVNDRPH
jgi:hypothetical protein